MPAKSSEHTQGIREHLSQVSLHVFLVFATELTIRAARYDTRASPNGIDTPLPDRKLSVAYIRSMLRNTTRMLIARVRENVEFDGKPVKNTCGEYDVHYLNPTRIFGSSDEAGMNI